MFYSHLPPNQGGKYSGFGYSRDPPPKSQSQELLDSTVSSLASSFSWLSAGAAKIALTAKDNASRYGNLASQKVIFWSKHGGRRPFLLFKFKNSLETRDHVYYVFLFVHLKF